LARLCSTPELHPHPPGGRLLFLGGIHIAKGFGVCNRGNRPDQPATGQIHSSTVEAASKSALNTADARNPG
jgi:hypothetical protein